MRIQRVGHALGALLVLGAMACGDAPSERSSPDAGAVEVSLEDDVARYREAVVAGSPDAADLERSLVDRGDDAVGPIAVLLDDPHPRVREAGDRALAAIGTTAAMDRVADSLMRQFNYGGTEATMSESAARLRRLGDAATPALERRYRSDPSFWSRVWVLQSIHSLKDRSATPLLTVALSDADPRIAGRAAWMLGGFGGPEVCRLLVPLLHSADVEKRLGAIVGLGFLGDRGAVAHLLEVLLAPNQSLPRPEMTLPFQLPGMLHEIAAKRIDWLTGETIGHDPALVRAWLAKNKPATSSSCP